MMRTSLGVLLICSVCIPITSLAQTIQIPRTGQTICYDADGLVQHCLGTGQDGGQRVGMEWPSPRFLANGDGTLTDQLTGLTWLADANCAATAGHDPDGTGDGTMAWSNVLQFVSIINTGGLPACSSGYNDWRAPNVIELESLVHGEGATEAWLTGEGFSNLSNDAYWSSTTNPLQPYNALFVGLYTGAVSNAGKDLVGAAWPVRGGPVAGASNPAYPSNPHKTGQNSCWDGFGAPVDCGGTGQDGELRAGVDWPVPRFTVSGEGTVTDNLTGTVWLQNANCIDTEYDGVSSDGGVAWQSALDFVAGINDGTYPNCGANHTDWQLPNRKQLLSLMDWSQVNPSLPAGHPFINAPDSADPNGYWTSTTYPTLTSWAWRLYHRAGQLSGAPKIPSGPSPLYGLVWPVRQAAEPPPPPGPVEFPDAALDQAIRTVLELPTGDISREALGELTELVAPSLGIADLTGLEYCDNLDHLNLSGNALTDLSPLSGLVGLSYLNLYGNQIVDVSPLSGLFTLVYLNLGLNLVSDITPLTNLSNLTDLYLDDNQIATTTALSFLSRLNNLALTNNNVSDLHDLVINLGLATGDRVWLEGNPLDLDATSQAVIDIRALQDRGVEVHHDPVGSLFADVGLEAAVREALGVPDGILLPDDLLALTELDASSRDIGDLGGIEYCTNLTSLQLNDNRIPEIMQLASLTNLASLDLGINRVDRLGALRGLSNLTWLNLSSNSLVDIAPLADLTGLTHLFLTDNGVSNISWLSGLENLTALGLSHNNIDDIEPLVLNLGLGSGDTVWLTGNRLSLWYGSQTVTYIWALEASGVTVHHDPFNYFPDNQLDAAVAQQLGKAIGDITLEDLQTMRVLDASGLGITDIRGVNLMLALESLYLQDNQVSDLSPLSALPNLQILNLANNEVGDLRPLTNVTTLSEVNLNGNPVTGLTPLVDNPGLGEGDLVWLRDVLTVQGGSSAVDQVWALRTRGVIVFHDPFTDMFADEHLEAAVAQALSINPNELRQDPVLLNDLEVLWVDHPEIASLEGIEYCDNLWNLRVRGGRISDMTPVKGMLSLTHLDLQGNQISDVTPLWDEHDLVLIDLSWNQITDVEPLLFNSALREGDEIRLQGNPLDLRVGSAPVRHMWLLHNRGAFVQTDPFYFEEPAMGDALLDAAGLSRPRDITLATLSAFEVIDYLNLEGLGIASLDGVEYSDNLTRLVISDNLITDLDPIQDLVFLNHLNMENNRVSDLSALRNLINLGVLIAGDNLIEDLGPLAELDEIYNLQLPRNRIVNIRPVSTGYFRWLFLSGNLISDIGPLSANIELGASSIVGLYDNPLDLSLGSDTVQYLYNMVQREVQVGFDSLRLRDDALNAAVRAALGLGPEEAMEFDHLLPLAQLTQLSVTGQGVEDLTGIEFLHGLSDLDLTDNAIEDLTPLATLEHLAELNLSGNRLRDLVALADHPAMDAGDTLWIHDNPLLPLWEGTPVHEQIVALGNRGVTVHHDGITTDPFPDAALEQAVRSALALGDLQSFTLSGLEGLTELDLFLTGVASLDGLQHCPNLASLNVRGTEVSDLTPLADLNNLAELNVGLSQVTDVSPLGGLSGLETLHLYGSPIADWAPIAGLTQLRTLSFGGTNPATLDWITHLADLTELHIEDSVIDDITPLSGLTRLEKLTWNHGSLADLTALQGMSSLRVLLAEGNRLADLSPLSELTALEQLALSGNEIVDLAPLQGLTELAFLSLDFNRIDDLAPLVENLGIGDGDILSLANNNLDMVVISDDVQNVLALEARGASVYHDPIVDYDGVDEREEQGPDGRTTDYDGNSDGTPDCQQANVASLHTYDGESYVTIDSNLPYTLASVEATDNPSPEAPPAGVEFPVGFFNFGINDVPIGAPAEVRIILPVGTTVTSYWKYGKTPDNDTSHWYEFTYDGTTGAEINGNIITLHFINNGRGDDWLLQDQYIKDPGAPVFQPPPASGGGGGGGCFLNVLGTAGGPIQTH